MSKIKVGAVKEGMIAQNGTGFRKSIQVKIVSYGLNSKRLNYTEKLREFSGVSGIIARYSSIAGREAMESLIVTTHLDD